MLKILYFASLRETLGVGSESIDCPAGVRTVGDLLKCLAERGGEWGKLTTLTHVRYAVNQEMARLNSPVQAGDEVAFFPPVTGGCT